MKQIDTVEMHQFIYQANKAAMELEQRTNLMFSMLNHHLRNGTVSQLDKENIAQLLEWSNEAERLAFSVAKSCGTLSSIFEEEK